MPDLRLTCLSAEARGLVLSEMHHIKGAKERETFTRLINQVAECPVGQSVGIATGAGKGSKAKRAPSAYNLFLKQCASSKEKGGQGRSFKECSAEWKAKKR